VAPDHTGGCARRDRNGDQLATWAGALGRGYATEAATAVRDYAFETLGLRRLIALIIRENHRSIAVARRIGMTLAGKIDVEGSTTLLYATSARAG
jgi:RimJ/RimL family protein N-acetyltransferase